MVSVYMNPEKLEEKIAALKEFATSVKEKNDAVDHMYNNEPIQSGGDHLKDIKTAIEGAANAIEVHAKDLSDCKTTMVNLNSNGVATHDLEGGISIEVPDDSAGLENNDKFQKWAQGATDAHDLRSGGGYGPRKGKPSELPSGRSFDEVMESMKANKDDTTYSNSFIDRVGPENLTKLGDNDANLNREAPVIGEILATASQNWSKEKSKKNADLIIEGMKVSPLADTRVPVFNKMIGLHDANGDGVNDLKFGADFLVSLGRGVETIDRTHWENAGAGNYDPILGVVDAMTNNKEAAREFLAPEGGSPGDINRIEDLMNRHPICVKYSNASDRWLGDETWTDNWTRLASITAEEHGEDAYDKTTDSPQAKQAAAITTGVVNTLGEEIKAKGASAKITDFARSNLSTALSKFPYGIDNTANGNTPLNTKEKDSDGKMKRLDLHTIMPRHSHSNEDEYWSNDIAWQPNFTVHGLAGVMQVVSEDAKELKKVAAPLGDMNKVKMIYAAAHEKDLKSKGQQSSVLEEAITSNTTTNAFMLGASRARVEDNAAKVDENNRALIDTVFAATSFIPGPGKNVAEIWKKAAEYGKTRSVDMIKDSVVDLHTGHEAAEKIESSHSVSEMNRISREDTIIQLMEFGIIDEDAVKNAEIRNNNDEPVSLYDEKGNFDISKVDKTVKSYLADRFINHAPDTPVPVYRGLKGMGTQFEDAYNRGHQ